MKNVFKVTSDPTKSRWDSMNFVSNLYMIFVFGLGVNEIVFDLSFTAFWDAVTSGSVLTIVAILFLPVYNVIRKIIKRVQEQKWNWGFWLEANVITNITGSLSIALIGAGVEESIVAVVVGTVTSVYNFLVHYFRQPKMQPAATTVA